MNTWIYPAALAALLVAFVTGYTGLPEPKRREVPPVEDRPLDNHNRLTQIARLSHQWMDPTKLSGPGVGSPLVPLPYLPLRRCQSATERIVVYNLGLPANTCTRRIVL